MFEGSIEGEVQTDEAEGFGLSLDEQLIQADLPNAERSSGVAVVS